MLCFRRPAPQLLRQTRVARVTPASRPKRARHSPRCTPPPESSTPLGVWPTNCGELMFGLSARLVHIAWSLELAASWRSPIVDMDVSFSTQQLKPQLQVRIPAQFVLVSVEFEKIACILWFLLLFFHTWIFMNIDIYTCFALWVWINCIYCGFGTNQQSFCKHFVVCLFDGFKLAPHLAALPPVLIFSFKCLNCRFLPPAFSVWNYNYVFSSETLSVFIDFWVHPCLTVAYKHEGR